MCLWNYLIIITNTNFDDILCSKLTEEKAAILITAAIDLASNVLKQFYIYFHKE